MYSHRDSAEGKRMAADSAPHKLKNLVGAQLRDSLVQEQTGLRPVQKRQQEVAGLHRLSGDEDGGPVAANPLQLLWGDRRTQVIEDHEATLTLEEGDQVDFSAASLHIEGLHIA